MTDHYRDIPSLLHEAKLIGLQWEPELASLRLLFECLLRNVDGSTVPDPVVELRLEGTEQVAAYYAPANVEVRPSEFVNDAPLRATDLREWKRQPCEVSVAIDSAHADFSMATSCMVDWLVGEPVATGAIQARTARRIHLKFENHSYGKDAIASGLYIGCETLQPMLSGVPLSMEDWCQQFESWWKGWTEHWSSKESEHVADATQPVAEDTFIPAGEDLSHDLTYRPPSESAFQLTANDAPAELLQPLEDVHSGLMGQDWVRMASAYPCLDTSRKDRAKELKDIHLGDEFGRWVYLRHVDSWWAEGLRACVIVRGIEHVMPDEEDPATNHETVLTYGLLKYEDRWIISTWSQGWPQYNSAPKLGREQSWRDGWNLDE